MGYNNPLGKMLQKEPGYLKVKVEQISIQIIENILIITVCASAQWHKYICPTVNVFETLSNNMNSHCESIPKRYCIIHPLIIIHSLLYFDFNRGEGDFCSSFMQLGRPHAIISVTLTMALRATAYQRTVDSTTMTLYTTNPKMIYIQPNRSIQM